MAGIKISDLPAATTPLAGTEQFALVQSSSTKVATVANIGDVLSNSFVTKTLYASTSGVYATVQSTSATWDSVYSSYQTTSADFAHENQDNCFQGTNCFTKLQAGFSNTACGSYAGVIGGYYNDACGGGSAVAGGNNNDTYANFSFIGGGDDNSICGSGVESAIIGGNNNYIAANHCRAAIAGGTSVTSVSASMLHAQSLYLKALPTSNPGVCGVVWNDSGTLKIST
tara:strand:+ start:167 stop:847 length:681 start_codon:yes stop_codon:yes gene_type:complete